jgi:mannosyltransferase
MTTVVDRPVRAPAPLSTLSRSPRWAVAGIGFVLVVGVALRFFVRSHLWLDETLSVEIARLPLRRIPGALRHDGAPPLYYVLLHLWMRVFGTGDWAVRAFSGVASTAMIPLMWFAGRRIGPRIAWPAVVLVASSPFAVHYATETRMYALVALLAVVGFLALARALEAPSVARLAEVAVVTALLLYTHYWAVYLLMVVGAWLVWRGWIMKTATRPDERPAARRSAVALVVGGLAFLPWLPTFLYQAAHTGTPWAKPATFEALVDVFDEFAGGGWQRARILALVLIGLCVLGLCGYPVDGRRIELHLPTRPRGRALAVILVGTPTVAIAVGMVTHTAFVARYTSVVFPLFVLLAALGASTFVNTRARGWVVGIAAALGLSLAAGGAFLPRTEAGDFARALKAQAGPGDVVAYCPDQVAPAVNRILGDGLQGVAQVTYPRGTPPGRIDWVDYGDAVKAAPVHAFAQSLVQRAGSTGGRIWLVQGRGYRPFNGRCTLLATELTTLTGKPQQQIVRSRPIRYFEHGTLYRYGG